jgi:hypothetical protein
MADLRTLYCINAEFVSNYISPTKYNLTTFL